MIGKSKFQLALHRKNKNGLQRQLRNAGTISQQETHVLGGGGGGPAEHPCAGGGGGESAEDPCAGREGKANKVNV